MSHALKSAEKDLAAKNIFTALLKLTTFHVPISWSNDVASRNMDDMSSTSPVSQRPMGWLKAHALRNMRCISVTAFVSHALMSSLNELAAGRGCQQTPPALELQKSSDMSVMSEVFHFEMGPYWAAAAAGSSSQRSTAFSSSGFVSNATAAFTARAHARSVIKRMDLAQMVGQIASSARSFVATSSDMLDGRVQSTVRCPFES
mmetsp:Transcript_7104/g.20920  ORF Transcript_7104/g.20920 Transcript_7104/m.20920 type:complete len:203 (+) Transcript_7104:450-1058(+)